MASIIDGTISNDNSRTLAPAAVAFQAALMVIMSVFTIFLFSFLRPRNQAIYEPNANIKLSQHKSHSLFGWLPPLVAFSEVELLEIIGFDAVVFLRFLRLLHWLFSGIAFLTCCVLIPINVLYNLRKVDPKNRDILSMFTLRDVEGSFLYVHIIITNLITFLVVFCVNRHWSAMIYLRQKWLCYSQSFNIPALQVKNIPKDLQSNGKLRDELLQIFRGTGISCATLDVYIGPEVGRFIESHRQWINSGMRPSIKIGGTCGCGSMQCVKHTQRKHRHPKATDYGIITIKDIRHASTLANMINGKQFPRGTEITLAPNLKELIWDNMGMSDTQLTRRRLFGFMLLTAVCFFNTFPLFIISILANLNTLRTYVGFLNMWFNASPYSFAFVSGVLPPAISGLFGFFLPIIIRWSTRYMGVVTRSKLDRAVVARYFAFLVISQLIVFTLIGVVFSSVHKIFAAIGKKASWDEIIDKLHQLPAEIFGTYIDQSSYWLTFFPLRGFLDIFDLVQIINLVQLLFKTHVFPHTARDKQHLNQPAYFQYAVCYSNMLFMAAVGFMFAPLAPLITLAAAIVFWTGSWVYKYQLLFVYMSKVDSGGRIWNVVINRLLFCVLLMHAFMILTIGIRFGFKAFIWIFSIPPIIIIFLFKIYINRTYLPEFHSVPGPPPKNLEHHVEDEGGVEKSVTDGIPV